MQCLAASVLHQSSGKSVVKAITCCANIVYAASGIVFRHYRLLQYMLVLLFCHVSHGSAANDAFACQQKRQSEYALVETH